LLVCDSTGSIAAKACDAVPGGESSFGSYPGGKSGAGIYQRLINQIPRHRILVTAFAGQCGVTRNIRPAEHTIVIDADETVCQWWDDWRRTREGRALEIHHCDSIEWLRFRFDQTEYAAAGSGDGRSSDGGSQNRRLVMRGRDRMSQKNATPAGDAQFSDARATRDSASKYFVFCDPPYVLSERSGKQYACELSDDDHRRLVGVVRSLDVPVMLCGYSSEIYASLDPWRSIDHRVPTRRGLQDERIWMNYGRPERLHDYRYVGDCRRNRERTRRRQRNWVSQLEAMSDRERDAMIEALLKVARSSD
jgi:site-specific DNA-adenine methylase